MNQRIKILIADDHPVVRKGVSQSLARQSNFEIVGEAVDGRDAVRLAYSLRPEVIVVDIDMPNLNGIAVADLIRRELPDIRVLVLSAHRAQDYVQRIIQSGARGYVLKDATAEELARAVEAVHRGEAFFSPEIARVALNQIVQGHSAETDTPQLTNREREVLIQIADGFSNKEIAVKLGVGVRTVETHRERIMRKLDIHNVAGLTRFAIAKGLIHLEAPVRN